MLHTGDAPATNGLVKDTTSLTAAIVYFFALNRASPKSFPYSRPPSAPAHRVSTAPADQAQGASQITHSRPPLPASVAYRFGFFVGLRTGRVSVSV